MVWVTRIENKRIFNCILYRRNRVQFIGDPVARLYPLDDGADGRRLFLVYLFHLCTLSQYAIARKMFMGRYRHYSSGIYCWVCR